MLDVISDFWKPVKKPANANAPDLSKLQIGSSLTFGYVPQVLLSGRRLKVAAINTYRFGEERMTSFVLAQEGDEGVSLILAGEEKDPYLALSRRIPFAERMKMFDPSELEAVVERADATRLSTHDVEVSWKHWVVGGYKKEQELGGIKGSVVPGDFRNSAPPAPGPDQAFDYFLLTSDNNEYAIEIERYADGRLELYATIYRRVSDVIEADHPEAEALSAPGVIAPAIPSAANAPAPLELVKDEPKQEQKSELKIPEPKPAEPVKPLASAPAPAIQEPKPAEKKPEPVSTAPLPFPAQPQQNQPVTQPQASTEKKPMQFPTPASSNGAFANPRTENKPMNTAEPENDAIECDLRVANKIIEEAIRNEMRLSDVVRRVIALPVANPDSVQIPVTLTDSDFQLLAIRYGLPAADRNAIKTRIIDELGDFSGGKKN